MTKLQQTVLEFIEPKELHLGSLLEPVYISLNSIPLLTCGTLLTKVGAIIKLAEGALNSTVSVADKAVKKHKNTYVDVCAKRISLE